MVGLSTSFDDLFFLPLDNLIGFFPLFRFEFWNADAVLCILMGLSVLSLFTFASPSVVSISPSLCLSVCVYCVYIYIYLKELQRKTPEMIAAAKVVLV